MPDRDAMIGSWMLESVTALPDGGAPFGAHPSGVLHYLADGRMAVMMAHDGRAPMSGNRLNASDADRLAAARSFTAYAGNFEVEGDRVVHHVDINSHPNDVGVDYVRIATLTGDLLTLATPPDLPADQRAMRLVWRRHASS